MPRFRITVEPLTPATESSPLTFEVDNHDDILAIARRMNGRFDLDEPTSQSFAIGLKLFAEVVLKNRQREPFSLIRPAMADFMQAVKGARPAEAAKTAPKPPDDRTEV